MGFYLNKIIVYYKILYSIIRIMHLSLALMLFAGAFLLVPTEAAPAIKEIKEPIVHDYGNHIGWFMKLPDACIEQCHKNCLFLKQPRQHVGCMIGCTKTGANCIESKIMLKSTRPRAI